MEKHKIDIKNEIGKTFDILINGTTYYSTLFQCGLPIATPS